MTGLDAEALRAGLRELASRSLAETAPGGRHRARHALLAEAAAARLLPGERRGAARAPGARRWRRAGKALAAEAADHWAAAGRDAEELRARLTAARAAERVSGYAEAAAHWQRAIELCRGRGADAAGRGRRRSCRAGTCTRSTRGTWPGTPRGPGRWPRRPAAGSPATPIRRSRRWSASAPRGSAASATCSSAGGRRPARASR